MGKKKKEQRKYLEILCNTLLKRGPGKLTVGMEERPMEACAWRPRRCQQAQGRGTSQASSVCATDQYREEERRAETMKSAEWNEGRVKKAILRTVQVHAAVRELWVYGWEWILLLL